MVAIASSGLGSGRSSALLVALGIAIGGFGWALSMALGLGALLAAYPKLLQILGIAGGMYLGWLGYRSWQAAFTGALSAIKPRSGVGIKRNIRYGLIITATNPKAALLWPPLAALVGGQTSSWPWLVLYAGGSSVVLFVIYAGYGLLFSTGGARQLYARFHKVSAAVLGTIFGVIGASMILRSAEGDF